MRALSERVELATQFNLTHSRLDSENYQIMNYGIGGRIGLHLDTNPFNDWKENGIGGGRFTTAMLYLSKVEVGGRTIFPKLLL